MLKEFVATVAMVTGSVALMTPLITPSPNSPTPTSTARCYTVYAGPAANPYYVTVCPPIGALSV
ncbi:MAG: hypothetical protein ACYDB7_09355 [Mycobacteriales bacterium]